MYPSRTWNRRTLTWFLVIYIYRSIPESRGKKLPVCHTVMVPWTAVFLQWMWCGWRETGCCWWKLWLDARENARVDDWCSTVTGELQGFRSFSSMTVCRKRPVFSFNQTRMSGTGNGWCALRRQGGPVHWAEIQQISPSQKGLYSNRSIAYGLICKLPTDRNPNRVSNISDYRWYTLKILEKWKKDSQ